MHAPWTSCADAGARYADAVGAVTREIVELPMLFAVARAYACGRLRVCGL